MGLTYGFYNSIGGDRRYNTEQISALFNGLINDGVFMSIGDALAVTASSGMNIVVGTGRAWFNSTWTDNDAPLPLTVEAAHAVLPRIDVVVLEVNANEATRANSIKIIKGTAASSPVAPTLVSTADVHQYPLCHIYVGANVVSIIQANITTKINTEECPFATGIIETNFTVHQNLSSSETVKGHIELATAAETTAGVDNTRAVHPAGLKVELDKKALATSLTTHTGTDASETVKGHVELATAAETTTGTDSTRAVHPAGLKVELDKKVNHSLATAINDFLVDSGSGVFIKKTLAEIKTLLGISTLNTLPTTTGTGSAYVVALTDFTRTVGQKWTAKFHTAGSGSPTAAVNGTTATALKKGDGTTTFLPKAGGTYTFVFDGTNFVVQGEGASGNAVASDLLSGKTADTDAGEIIGTMVDRGAYNLAFAYTDPLIPVGYHNGAGKLLSPTFSAGEVEQFYHNQSNPMTNTSYAVATPNITCKRKGTIRVAFDMKRSATSNIVYGRIYKNGVAVGTERNMNSSTAVTYTEDIAVNAGDVITIYAKTANAATSVYIDEIYIKTAETTEVY